MNRLVVFTALYPFGNGTEVFLEDEVHYLSRAFDEVVFVPYSGGNKSIRSLPDNCKVIGPVLKNRKAQYLKAFIPGKLFYLFIKDFFQKKAFLSKIRFHIWLVTYIHTNCLLRSSEIKQLSKTIKKEDICYFYWGKNENTLSVLWKNRCHFVSRFHGEWDLWEESSDNYAAIRNEIANSLDCAYFISSKGENYFKSKYPQCTTKISRLGAFDNGVSKRSEDGVLRVLSCSSVYSLKRVPLIFEAVNCIDNCQIEWTHIGGGEDFELLKELVEKNRSNNLKVNLCGQQNHDYVIGFYKHHKVDVFLNLSTNEGIPVSIMEAISFDVPVVATNVGATSEIVTEKTGLLVNENPKPQEVAEAIMSVVQKSLSPRSYWMNYYNADTNYTAFVNHLKSL